MAHPHIFVIFILTFLTLTLQLGPATTHQQPLQSHNHAITTEHHSTVPLADLRDVFKLCEMADGSVDDFVLAEVVLLLGFLQSLGMDVDYFVSLP